MKKLRVKATGQSVIKSVTPGQQVIKIVNDELVELLSGKDQSDHSLKIDSPPASILMVGLQGSGKTTTSAKLANFLKRKENKKVLMASLDTSRPAAMEQLKILGNENQIDVLEIIQNQKPLEIATRAEQQARLGGYDVFILDTAGRMHISENLMDEIIQIKSKDSGVPFSRLHLARRPSTTFKNLGCIPNPGRILRTFSSENSSPSLISLQTYKERLNINSEISLFVGP